MGQYYRVVIGDDKVTGKDGIKVYDVNVKNKEWTGMKLMEHSWWNNELLCAVGNLILDNPIRIAWVGDYTEKSDLTNLNKHKKPFTTAFVWGARAKVNQFESSDFEFPTKNEYPLYLINHDKKIYVDLNKYYELNNRKGWCINPISLLTATSNDRGGGDYHDGYPDAECCGTWAWDLVELKKDLPSGYIEDEYNFVEE